MGRLDGPRPSRTGVPLEQTRAQTYRGTTVGGTAVCRPRSSCPHLTVGSSLPPEREHPLVKPPRLWSLSQRPELTEGLKEDSLTA